MLFQIFRNVTSKIRSSDIPFAKEKLFYTLCCYQNILGIRLSAFWYSLPSSRSQCIIIECKTTQIVTNYCLVSCLCVHHTCSHARVHNRTRAHTHMHTHARTQIYTYGYKSTSAIPP